jgi:site-specific recombinase
MSNSLFARWRAARDASHQLDSLLAQANPAAPVGTRNEWLMELGYWLRRPIPAAQAASALADSASTFSEHTRLRWLLQVLDRNVEQAARFSATLRSILRDNDARSLFADTGMAARPGLFGELISRVHHRVLPVAPNQAELSVVFALLFISARDVAWVAALDEALISRLMQLVSVSVDSDKAMLPELAGALDDSIVLLCHQIAATALEAPIRQRLDNSQENARVLMQLSTLSHELMRSEHHSEARPQLLNSLRAALAQARTAIDSVYEHLERYGVSVDVVFQVERTRLRIDRVDQLLAVWADRAQLTNYSALTAQLIEANLNRSSIGGLLAETYALLGRKVVERSAETGEHYIARTRTDYFGMLRMAAGGGVVTAFTVYLKFFISALQLNKFVEGVLFSFDYVASFLTIHFAQFTLATKQPAMTAPALAKKLEDVATREGRAAFVEETAALIRSQVAAITGNLALVFPVALAVQLLAQFVFERNLITPEKAEATINSFSLLGPTPFYAAFTGVLLWLSSLTAGWADNWFALHRLHDALAFQRRLKWVFGEARALRVAGFVRHHVAGVVAAVSLGLMLGLVPVLFAFFAMPVDVRHVTLSTGSVAAAIAVLGWDALQTPALWWAVGGIASMAVLNLAVSFALAFSMALRSQGLRAGARRILQRDVLRYVAEHPLKVILPPKM